MWLMHLFDVETKKMYSQIHLWATILAYITWWGLYFSTHSKHQHTKQLTKEGVSLQIYFA